MFSVLYLFNSFIHSLNFAPAQLLQSCPILCDPVDCSLPGSSVHGILQTRILEGVAMPSSRRSSRPRDRTFKSVSPALAGDYFTRWVTWKPSKLWVSTKCSVLYQMLSLRFNSGLRCSFEIELRDFPVWFSGEESTSQCRGHRFDPWSEKSSYAVRPSAHVPQLLKPSP